MAAKIKKAKHLSKRIVKAEAFFYLVLVAIFLGGLGWLTDSRYQDAHPVNGQVSESSLGADNYKQLNLGLAAKAYYSNTAIQKSRTTTSGAGFTNMVFDFKVPKDNLTEHGLMSLPTSPAPPHGYPVVILLHGYANPWSYSTYNAYLGDMEFYAAHGFAVLKPDFRGQGLSIADGTPDGAYYSMSYNTDVMSLIAATRQTHYLSKTDINLWGHSMGAYIALRAAVLSPSIKNVILLSGPVGNIADMFSSYVAISDRLNPTASAIRADMLDKFGTPVTNPSYWNNTSPLNYLSKTKAHIQIHVGSADKIVPPHFSADLDKKLTEAKKDHEYYVYPGGTHGLGKDRSLIWSRSLSALTKT